MVLQNYVILQEGIPARLHFFDHAIEKITITDQMTGEPAIRRRLVFEVDKLNHEPVASKYSTCLLYTSPSPRDATLSRMPSSA